MALSYGENNLQEKNVKRPSLDPSSSNDLGVKTNSKQGSNWIFIFFIVPALTLVWAFLDKIKLPNDELNYLKFSLQVGLISYIIFWLLSFYRTTKDKNLIMVSLFLFGLWQFSCLFIIAKFNIFFDHSPVRIERSKVFRTQLVSGGKNSKGYCIAYVVDLIDGMEKVDLKLNYCEDLTSGKNGIEVHFREGALGLPYKVDSIIIKDYDSYMKEIH